MCCDSYGWDVPFAYILYTLGYEHDPLGGKPTQVITQLNSITSQYESKEICASPTACVYMQSIHPPRRAPQDLLPLSCIARVTAVFTCFFGKIQPGCCCWYTSGGLCIQNIVNDRQNQNELKTEIGRSPANDKERNPLFYQQAYQHLGILLLQNQLLQ